MGKSDRKLMQTIMLTTIEYVLDVGIEEACSDVLKDNPDLSAYPKLKEKADSMRKAG
jgi:hypothetical protein